MKFCVRRDIISVAALSTAILAQPAIAQAQDADAAASGSSFGDIVVTARKVGEASQSLPIAISAFSGSDLSEKVVLNIRDIQTVTPGLTVSANSQGGAPIFAIRGTATENLIDGGVALYLNDVALNTSIGLVNQFYDVSTVEILKGPQGTQFGTNTTGGTITVRTNEPTDNMEVFLKAGYGNYDRKELEGMINVPINDVLKARFAGQWIKRDGFIKNPLGAGVIPREFGGEDHYSLRGSLLLDSGPITNLIVADYYHEDNQQLVQVPVAFRPNAQGVDLAALGQQLGDRFHIYIAPNPGGVDRPIRVGAKIWGVMDRLNADLSDNLSLRNVVGYRKDHTTPAENYSGTTLVQINVFTDTRISQWSDDFTLQYHSDDNRLRVSAGGYWSKKDKKQGIIANAAEATFVAFSNAPLNFNIRNYQDQTSTTKALYANGEFDLTSTLTVNGGFRYNWDKVKTQFSYSAGVGLLDNGTNFFPSPEVPCSLAALKSFPVIDAATCTGYKKASFKAPSWTIGLTNHFSPRVLGYVKVSHGYLAGGLNTSIREVPIFDPETKTEFEAGLKGDWTVASRPLRVNVAAFYGKIKNKQVVQNTNYDDGASANGVFNAAKETVYGLDLETRLSPFEGLTLEANYNYVHAKFDSFLFPAIGGNGDGLTGVTLNPAADLSGNTPAQTPKHQLNLAATVDLPIDPSSGKLSATVSTYHSSKVSQGNVLSPYNRSFGEEYNILKSYWVTNASANWENVLGSPISVQVYVRNLFDRKYTVFRNDQFQAFGYATAIYGQPRTYGFSASVRF